MMQLLTFLSDPQLALYVFVFLFLVITVGGLLAATFPPDR